MAVEARHLNTFPPQMLSNRKLMMNGVEGFGNACGVRYGVVTPLSGTTTAATETLLNMYDSPVMDDIRMNAAAIKSESGVTYAVPASRKRLRDSINPLVSSLPGCVQSQSANNRCGSLTFLGEDISFQFQQQQLEIDRFIAQHMEKVRMEIEERRNRYSRRMAAAVEQNIMKTLKAKEDEIEKMGKIYWALEERVRTLSIENQIWRDLAQTNEATANALRSNLEQVLAQVQDEPQQRHLADDAQSCCGSNSDETDSASNRDFFDSNLFNSNVSDEACNKKARMMRTGNSNRMCRSCGNEESCVLLLPCRHLCLCAVCGSSLHTCPVCNSINTASVHVNFSS